MDGRIAKPVADQYILMASSTGAKGKFHQKNTLFCDPSQWGTSVVISRMGELGSTLVLFITGRAKGIFQDGDVRFIYISLGPITV